MFFILGLSDVVAFLIETIPRSLAGGVIHFLYNKKEDIEFSAKETATKYLVKKELAETKADIIKWMFIFWIGQIAVTFAIIYFGRKFIIHFT